MKTNTIQADRPSRIEAEPKPEIYAETVLRRVNEITEDALSRVITDDKNILASADRLFRHPFGRDFAISAERLLERDGELAMQGAKLMVAYQGVKFDRKTEEEPGKIFHELKFRGDGGPEQRRLFDRLSASLGIGDQEKFISYTSVDATLEFIHMVANCVKTRGEKILHLTPDHQRKEVTVEQGMYDAVQYLRRNIQTSDIGLVGARRINPKGVIVPDLLDGGTSFMHSDGKTLINYTREVNTINFQSLSYQALRDAASVITNEYVSEEERAEWLNEADELRRRTIEYFWMPEYQRVAMAIDRDEDGHPRRVETNTILPAVAVRTGIFDSRPDIIKAIFKGLYTPSMMTCVGPRTQSLEVDIGYTRYQEPPWPVLVGRVVEGAIHCGADDIAVDLTERMLMGVYVTGQAEEFHQVTRGGELGVYAGEPSPEVVDIVATNKPEAPQAWSAATMWWLTHTALPLLASRRLSLPEQARQVVDGVNLTLNREIKTVAYNLKQEEAWKIEREILLNSAARYESKATAGQVANAY